MQWTMHGEQLSIVVISERNDLKNEQKNCYGSLIDVILKHKNYINW